MINILMHWFPFLPISTMPNNNIGLAETKKSVLSNLRVYIIADIEKIEPAHLFYNRQSLR